MITNLGTVAGATVPGGAPPLFPTDPATLSPQWRGFVNTLFGLPNGWTPPGGWAS
jgi:hypothetical protein